VEAKAEGGKKQEAEEPAVVEEEEDANVRRMKKALEVQTPIDTRRVRTYG